VSAFVYTNVDLDGTLTGLRPDEVEAISESIGDGELVWSGGIGSIDDLRQLSKLAPPNLAGVIVGKALYEQRFTVAQAVEALS
jgi:phosphoribosylformimino-5-aminoimidazole carboxamide ribotide isomerase